ncbi:MAG TPA: alcohol dehydrogenase catalytic domain-containing protein [Vicinamibacterales bacterium]|nr:alcohol dehydrogenase catalytic domain-containing protein [Vicinamibacterales bacterium]
MRAAVFAREGVLELQQRPEPRLDRADEVLLEVEGCGLCGTDLHILASPPGHPATPGVVLGHEFIGRVREIGGGVRSLAPGRRVAVAPNLACGVCRACQAGRPNHCTDFTTLGIFRDGGLASLVAVPESACHPIADAVPFEDAVWTEILSCVMGSADNVKAMPGETALVIGGGPAGALHALLFAAAGARVIVADRSRSRLEVLARAGIPRVVDVSAEPLAEVVREETADGADIVVDAVGDQLDTALDLVRSGGRISLFGMNSHARPAVRQNTITRKELTIVGSYVGVHTFPRAIAILERGVIAPRALLTDILPLDRVHDALARLRAGDAMKIAIRP